MPKMDLDDISSIKNKIDQDTLTDSDSITYYKYMYSDSIGINKSNIRIIKSNSDWKIRGQNRGQKQ